MENQSQFVEGSFMSKCISCGYIRHGFVLNCPKCGSFYSTFEGHTPAEMPKNTTENAIALAGENLNAKLEEMESASMKNEGLAIPEKIGFFEWLQHPVKIQIKYIIITAWVLLMLTIRVVLCN
jgi:hypothetical protein